MRILLFIALMAVCSHVLSQSRPESRDQVQSHSQTISPGPFFAGAGVMIAGAMWDTFSAGRPVMGDTRPGPIIVAMGGALVLAGLTAQVNISAPWGAKVERPRIE
ncbi:MAG: hypothetical protein ACK5XQ_06465 [Flavobacteriales bacterium]|jgi:hypothetical protein